MDKGNSDLSIFIRHFEVHNKTEGKSPRTVEWYNEVLGMLYVWLEDRQLSTCLKDLDEMVIVGCQHKWDRLLVERIG